jgi:hypothetical protein
MMATMATAPTAIPAFAPVDRPPPPPPGLSVGMSELLPLPGDVVAVDNAVVLSLVVWGPVLPLVVVGIMVLELLMAEVLLSDSV